MRPVEEQVAIIMQGTEYGDPAIREHMTEELRRRLGEAAAAGRPLRVYCGFDPTTSDLHLGHTVPLFKLRQFQDLGHEVIFLIGSFTSTIGDPSDKDRLRPQLTLEETLENARSYAEQAYAVLDRSKTIIRYNHNWLSELSFADVIRLASNFTVQQFLARENFRNRYDAGEPIYLHELFYALMQGYDAVALETDVQVGGTDQLFNIVTAGRKLQTAHDQEPQVAVILDILPGTDGEVKMSKSLGNHIPIKAEPADMYGKVMSLPDHVMPLFFKLVTRYEPPQVAEVLEALASGSRHPRDVKMELARAIVAFFHNDRAAQVAEEHFRTVFQRKELPEDMPALALAAGSLLVDVIDAAGIGGSKSQIRRLIKQGAVRLDGDKVEEVLYVIEPADQERIIQVGKRHFLRILPA
jgi:tyrosyl-tRNA synthetase